MRFTKMHGAGNDYVYVDCFHEPVPGDLARLAIAVSDRHQGIGSDGLILIRPSNIADARMQMFNADGSEAEMCGNGLRCVAKFVYEHGIARKEKLRIETRCGVQDVQLFIQNGKVSHVRVCMGKPILKGKEVPTLLPGDPPLDARLDLGENQLTVTCVSMGNPHCVTFVENLNDASVLGLGPIIECHPAFPSRVNVEFVQIVSPREIKMRVWERGAGETQACGSGACAALVAGVLTGRTERQLVCRLPGGQLELEWSESSDVLLTGQAVEVYQGNWLDAGTVADSRKKYLKPQRRAG